MPLSTVIADFVIQRQALHYSPHTIRNYTNTFKQFTAWLGCDPDPEAISQDQVIRFLASLDLSRKTVRNYYTDLSSLWGWLLQNNLASSNPVLGIPVPRASRRAIVPFTLEDIRALLASAEAGQNPLRDRAMILLLLDTGLRASELCGLMVADISLISRRLVITGKGDKERYLVFSPVTLEAIRASLAGRLAGPLFGNRQHTPLNRHAVRLAFRRIGQRAGVLRCYPHRMRHTFAIQFLRNGGNVYALQAALGHSTLDMVKRYLEIVQADIDVQMDKASPVKAWGL